MFIIGFAELVPSVTVSHWPPRDPREALGFDPPTRTLSGIFLAQLAIGVLGVLLITGEYATGMIRATFAAVPTRLPVLWAKAAAFAVVTLALMVPTVLVAFLIGQAILTSKHLQTGLGASGVLRAVIGAALFLTVVDCWGLVSGATAQHRRRHLDPVRLALRPADPRPVPADILVGPDQPVPSSNAGEAITHSHPDPTLLAPWTGLGLFFGYAVIVVIFAAISLRRRDA